MMEYSGVVETRTHDQGFGGAHGRKKFNSPPRQRFVVIVGFVCVKKQRS
jgi:hypothetical protein